MIDRWKGTVVAVLAALLVWSGSATASENADIVITVSDTGIGMSAEEVERLFGEFVRIRNAKTANILGSGLGLSIVKKLAQLYGGEATVESTPDVGTKFTVRLRDQEPNVVAEEGNVGAVANPAWQATDTAISRTACE